jgi:UDP-N-acetylglucosamine--N-acetylmuramyl-(pentapeptide) pyrophosphoryl-undecaprenol N-acetylglucosamine transferase
MNSYEYRFIFAGGGTGGHLYPAVAVAEQIIMLKPDAKILFIGTKDKIESRVIPKLGYAFKTIWISGFSRKFNIKNLLFPIKLAVSFVQSILINIKFKPHVAVGAGAYVSGPIVRAASIIGSKVVLLEQNSYPGVTNRMLEKKADSIHLSFEDSSKYFKEKSKLKITGNPIRLTLKLKSRNEAAALLGLDQNKKILLVIGGSLGAGSINEAVRENHEQITGNDIQIIWQTGEHYFDKYKDYQSKMVKIVPFISDMSAAYSAADLIAARAGATTIAEAAFLGLPVLFIPSTNVAANHQYKNAESIVAQRGGIMIEDKDIGREFGKTVIETIGDTDLLNEIKKNIKKFSRPDAAKEIAYDILRLAGCSEYNK